MTSLGLGPDRIRGARTAETLDLVAMHSEFPPAQRPPPPSRGGQARD
jgi:hypothetical protein